MKVVEVILNILVLILLRSGTICEWNENETHLCIERTASFENFHDNVMMQNKICLISLKFVKLAAEGNVTENDTVILE